MERSEREGGLRERKRRDTLARIAEVGLRLFVERGYDATTLEAIAGEAGISARTFFYYFKTKDEILHHWQSTGFLEALGPRIVDDATKSKPFDVVRRSLLALVSQYENEKSVIVDSLLNSTETLRASKQAIFLQMERTVLAALCARCPRPERQAAHRMVAMVSIGAMRLAMDEWRQDGGRQSLVTYLEISFTLLTEQV